MKVIEAKAVISAEDKTGNVFDKIAAKMKGVKKSAKAIGDAKAPKFTASYCDELHLKRIRATLPRYHSSRRHGQRIGIV